MSARGFCTGTAHLPVTRIGPLLGIVVVSYHSDDRTVSFITKELIKIRVPYKVVVVDNGASPEEAGALAARIPGVKVLRAENGGYAKGNNLGAEWLKENVAPTHILFSNDDISIRSESLVEVLLDRFALHPEIGAIGPEVVGLDGVRQSPEPYIGLWKRYFWMYLSSFFLSEEKKRRRFMLDYPERAQEGCHYKLSGSFVLVDAPSFFRAGKFDEQTFLYAEENILSERFSAIGRQCWFCPSVRVVHEHGKTIKNHFQERSRALLQYDSMAYYYRTYKGYSRFETHLLRLFLRLILTVR